MKKVLITGGSGGIGAGLVRAFCQNGDKVVFTYHKNLEAAKSLSAETGATALCADLGDSEQVSLDRIFLLHSTLSHLPQSARRVGGD